MSTMRALWALAALDPAAVAAQERIEDFQV